MTEGTYLTTRQVAERFHISIQTVLNWQKQKLIPCFSVGATRRFLLSDVEEFEERSRTGHE